MLKVLPGCDLADVPMIVLTIDPASVVRKGDMGYFEMSKLA